MLTNSGDIINDVLFKLNQSTAQAFYTDDILADWLDQAHQWAASFHKWPFTEKLDTSLLWANGTEVYNYPTAVKFKSNSIRLLQVNYAGINYRLQKLNFEDYQIFREEQATANDRIWAEFDRQIYINPYMILPAGGSGGSIMAFGQTVIGLLDHTDPSATTIFSNADEEGNEALVYKVISYAKMREQTLNLGVRKGAGVLVGAAAAYEQQATQILENIWKRILEERYSNQSKNRGIFKRMDFLKGAARDDIFKRDQFY